MDSNDVGGLDSHDFCDALRKLVCKSPLPILFASRKPVSLEEQWMFFSFLSKVNIDPLAQAYSSVSSVLDIRTQTYPALGLQ